MLSECKNLDNQLSKKFENIQNEKKIIRKTMEEKKLIKNDSDIRGAVRIPTTCGIDGSYYVDQLLSVDIIGVAAVAVEGLTPPSETRHWPKPRHIPFVGSSEHSDVTSLISRALMMTFEYDLAINAPHDLVFLDGSITTPLIYINQSLQRIKEGPKILSKNLIKRIPNFLNNYKEVLLSKRTDKVYAAIPKYSSRQEISKKINLTDYDDRALLTFILKSGEYTTPLQFQEEPYPWHINIENVPDNDELKLINEEIKNLLNDVHILYYRPQQWLPSIRIEISKSIATNNQRLALLLEGLQYQCKAPGVMEPYPTYMADRMVKHMSTALPALRKHVTQEMADKWEEEINDIYLAMHAYRT